MKTIQQVAELFQVHRNTINNWIKTGKIKAVRIGRTVRISESEIRRVMAEGRK